MPTDGLLPLLARAVGGFNDSVIVTNGERDETGVRRIVYVNAAFTEMTGFTADEARGKTPDILMGPETDQETLSTIQRAREIPEAVRVELLHYRKDRSTFWAEVDVVPILDDDGLCTHFMGVLRDITKRKNAYSRLFEAERLAAIGTLAAGVAHEMNNPLAYLLTNISFVEESLPKLVAAASTPDDWSDLVRTVEDVRHGAMRLAGIVRDIKTFSSVDAQESIPCRVSPILVRAVKMARAGMPDSAPIELRCDDEVPRVLADPNRLAQAILNVLINALDAVPADAAGRRRGQVQILARGNGDSVEISIRDDGVGIPPDVLPRILDPFFTTKEVGKGVGLGLSISHSIIQAMHGHMSLESAVGRGTTVHITLPRASVSIPHSSPALETHRDLPPVSRRLRVLVVDDEEMVARAIRRALRARDDVVTCEGGHAALDLLANDEFDVILCDLSMPRMSGGELYVRVAETWPGREKRIIIMTGGAASDSGRQFLDRVKPPRLDKPVDLAFLREHLDAIRSRQE